MAQRVDLLFTLVADTADVVQVILGDQGVLAGARPGLVVVDMSTISPAATRALARRLDEQGVEMLDAPCLLYTSPSPRDRTRDRMPSSA